MKKLILLIVIYLLTGQSFLVAQTTYLPLHGEEEYLLDRLETKSGALSPYFWEFRPISRKDAMAFIKSQRENILHGDLSLSSVDQYDIMRAESVSSEWVTAADGIDAATPSKHPLFNFLYEVQPDAIHIHTDNFFLAVNPVIYAEAAKENSVKNLEYINTRGLELRGRILNKIGFYTMLADDQERPAMYVRSYEQAHQAFPRMGYYVANAATGNYDLFLARGYVDVPFFKEHLNVTFGYDNNFSGVGIRSLFLSDDNPPATFLRLRAHWRRFGYESLFLQLTADYANNLGDRLYPQKYASIQQLGYQARPWLNIGVVECSVFSAIDQLKATDLIPVIGYQTLARSLGAPQKTSLGLWFKAIARRHFQFYGQAYFDRLNLAELTNGWWGNQWGLQLGGKYFDAFHVSNLDLQGEVNLVKPFTYASGGNNTDYTHYNQPLAHPLGAGFDELIGQIRYQPFNKLYLSTKAIYSLRGTNYPGDNTGVNPLENWNSRLADNGFGWVPDANRNALYLNLNVAYELRPNFFLEAGTTDWSWKINGSNTQSTSIYGGLRWNISRKEYDYY